jgi:hypothetical protein
MLFGADIPCNVTKTSEGHERPFTSAWSLLEAAVAEWECENAVGW